MCGVAGFKSEGEPPKKWHKRLSRILECSESRGHHATGVYLWDGQKSILVKQPKRATEFVKTGEFKALREWKPKICLAHTRWATQGKPEEAGNNHPIEYGDFILIHNGHISNDAELRTRYGLPKEPEVDSFVIVALLDRFKALYRSSKKAMDYVMELLMGSYVVVAFDKKSGQILAFRNTKAWHVDTKKKGETWWASEDDILKGKKRSFVTAYGDEWGGYSGYYSHAGTGYGGYDSYRRIPGYGVHARTCTCSVCEEEKYFTQGRYSDNHIKPEKIPNGFPVQCSVCYQPYYWTPSLEYCPTCYSRGWKAISDEVMDDIIATWETDHAAEHGAACLCETCMNLPDIDRPYMSRGEAAEFEKTTLELDGGTSASVEMED